MSKKKKPSNAPRRKTNSGNKRKNRQHYADNSPYSAESYKLQGKNKAILLIMTAVLILLFTGIGLGIAVLMKGGA